MNITINISISIISTTLENFDIIRTLKTFFGGLSTSYEYSETGVLRYLENPNCTD